MTLVATDTGGGSFEIPSEGTRLARCIQVIDIGHQFSEYYQKSAHKVVIGWELPSCLQQEGDRAGEPMMIWRRYTVSLNENAWLRKHLESWRGRSFTDVELAGFDIGAILDKPCQVSITHRKDGSKTYADVQNVMAMGEGQVASDRYHDLVKFDIDNPDTDIFAKLGKNMQATIEKSEERKASTQADAPIQPAPYAGPGTRDEMGRAVSEAELIFPESKVKPPVDDDCPF